MTITITKGSNSYEANRREAALTHHQQYFSYIMAISFSGGRSWSTRREPPIMGKQLENFITCGCESNAPFL
jgi:hypothetical protein